MRVFEFNSAIVRTPGKSVVNGLRDSSRSRARFRNHRRPSTRLTSPPCEPPECRSPFGRAGAISGFDLRRGSRAGFQPGGGSCFVPVRRAAWRKRRSCSHARGAVPGSSAIERRLRRWRRHSRDARPRSHRALRTNGRAGAADLRELLASIGLNSQIVDVPPGTLHLKSDCSLVDEETVLATEELAESGTLSGFRILVVPKGERSAANALRVNDVMFIRAGCPRTLEMLEKHGFEVLPCRRPKSPRSTADCLACRCAGLIGWPGCRHSTESDLRVPARAHWLGIDADLTALRSSCRCPPPRSSCPPWHHWCRSARRAR